MKLSDQDIEYLNILMSSSGMPVAPDGDIRYSHKVAGYGWGGLWRLNLITLSTFPVEITPKGRVWLRINQAVK